MAKEAHNESTMTKKEKEREYRIMSEQLLNLERRKKNKAVYGLLLAMVGALMLTMLFALNGYGYSWLAAIAISCVFSLVVYCFLSSYLYLVLEMKESTIRRKLIDYETDVAKNKVSEDVFKNSIEMSYTYLNQYYQQTRDHAQRGFVVTLGIAIFGAVLISGGIVAMFFGKVNPSYITCAAGVVTEFIAAVFFYLYNRTVSSMSNYHNKLVLSQNVSIALRVAESLSSEDQAKTKNEIIHELLKNINVHLVGAQLGEGRQGDGSSAWSKAE